MTESANKSTVVAEADWPLLEAICHKAGVPVQMVVEMLECECRLYGMGRRHGIRERLKELLERGVEEQVTGGAR